MTVIIKSRNVIVLPGKDISLEIEQIDWWDGTTTFHMRTEGNVKIYNSIADERCLIPKCDHVIITNNK